MLGGSIAKTADMISSIAKIEKPLRVSEKRKCLDTTHEARMAVAPPRMAVEEAEGGLTTVRNAVFCTQLHLQALGAHTRTHTHGVVSVYPFRRTAFAKRMYIYMRVCILCACNACMCVDERPDRRRRERA